MMDALAAASLVGVTRLLVGARAQWRTAHQPDQCLYFANHSSHLDTLAIWSALDAQQRRRTRPVAARDYWDKPGVRGYIAHRVLDAVLIDRKREHADADPLTPVFAALQAGSSLILFPEGTRTAQRLPQRFRGGLHRITEAFPQLQLIPTYLDTLHRSMPKGVLIPLPLYCNVRFGNALPQIAGEDRGSFLERARNAVVELA